MEGNEARDFEFSYPNLDMKMHNPNVMRDGKLSDYLERRKMFCLRFIPAPYSYSCAMEVTRFDTFAEEQLLERVRNSTLKSWKFSWLVFLIHTY
jgi:alkyl hydroperoxide reductase subunit AhpC